METALFTCFGTVVALVGAVLLFVYVVIPIIGHIFSFTGRLCRFVYQELRDLILLPVAIFIGGIKLLRATLCVVLARWDIAHSEMDAAKRRFAEAYNKTVAVCIDNPLRIFAIEPKTPQKAKKPIPRYVHTGTSTTTFEGYTVIGTLQAGGSGAKLYVAQPNHNPRQVVIKCFDISSGSQLPQIVRESRAMESAKKLGLVIEHHLDTERFWYAMPYHAGDHLGVVTHALHTNNPTFANTQFELILRYQHALLQTLKTYHNAGLWHKDVKPDNIIIHGGDAHLVDLGLVTPLGSAMTLTTHGTEYFRDPELVRQANRGVKVHQVDGSKFDVYGAGAVLYFMLENTFPAQGGLSSFNKQSPECLHWIVRRAMADYDKRYASIEEMLQDVETVLRTKNIASVRPADLPSMAGDVVASSTRRLPARTTPSTGGGPFPTPTYKTKPIGLLALLAAIVIGVAFVWNTPDETVVQPPIAAIQTSVIDFPIPDGRVLVVNELAVLDNEEIRRVTSNTLAQLTVAGWDIFVDQDTEARVRTWLPLDVTLVPNSEKLKQENLAGILVLRQQMIGEIEFVLIETVGDTVFAAVQYESD
jgi:serine/threonine protein kinase